VRDKEKALLGEIIAKLNDLFEGVTDDDQLVYVNHAIKGKLLEFETLVEQAANNTKEQFADSPDLPVDRRYAYQTRQEYPTALDRWGTKGGRITLSASYNTRCRR
jgi:hypothetical protein